MKKNTIRFALAFVLILTLALSISVFATGGQSENQKNPVSNFTDVKQADWFYGAVDYNVNLSKTMNGVSATQFQPLGQMTRAQFVTILGRFNGVDVSKYNGEPAFKDVVKDSWYAPYVKWAVEKGITKGTSETTFSPDAPIERQQAATFMARFLKACEPEYPSSTNAVKSFKDAAYIAGYAKDSVEELRRIGILRGDNNTNLNPTSSITRAEGATMLMRMSMIHASLNSSEEEWIVVENIAPTCTKGGRHMERCMQTGESRGTAIGPMGHDWQATGKTGAAPFHLEQHEVCYICNKDVTELGYEDLLAHLKTHSYSDPSRMQTKLVYVKVYDNECHRDEIDAEYKCSRCGEVKYEKVELKAVNKTSPMSVFKMVSTPTCSTCGKDCSTMTNEQWNAHIQSHMLDQGRMAYRYDYWQHLEVAEEDQTYQSGGRTTDGKISFEANILEPDYEWYTKAPATGHMKVIRCKTCNILIQFKLYDKNDKLIYQYQIPSSIVDQHDKNEGNSSAEKWSRTDEPCVYAYEQIRIFHGFV